MMGMISNVEDRITAALRLGHDKKWHRHPADGDMGWKPMPRPKSELRMEYPRLTVPHSNFGFSSSFEIRASSFQS
jgi:hypothetical protein